MPERSSEPLEIFHEIQLTSYAKDSSVNVEYVLDGPITASETHRSIQITISSVSRTIDILQGYQGQVTASKTYPNNSDAFTAFLAALNLSGFTSQRSTDKGISSQSVCPTGSRTHYIISRSSKDLMNLWSATCSNGSFAGNRGQVDLLFRQQIPDYDQLTRQVDVSGVSAPSIF